MSKKKPVSKKKPAKPTAAEAAAAKAAAEEKLKKAIESDQAWLDENLKGKSDAFKDEVFRQLSKKCATTTRNDGKIVLSCSIKSKFVYCVDADPFICDSGQVASAKGCKLSGDVSKALNDESTCIDGSFVSEEEGGSYLSPYVPWGPFGKQAKDGKPQFTTGNSSGVTIGTGVDLGGFETEKQQTDYLERLGKAGVSQETRDKLKPLLGKKREDACKALRDAMGDGPRVFPAKDVDLIDADAMKSRVPQLKNQFNAAKKKRVAGLKNSIAKEKKKKKPDQAKIDALQEQIDGAQGFDDLSCADQTVLFSTLYHEGSINKSHTKAYVNALIDGDSDAAEKALEAKTKNSNPLISNRGKSELQYKKKKKGEVGDSPVASE